MKVVAVLLVAVTLTSCQEVFKGKCDVTYNSKCFQVHVYPAADIDFNDAEAICKQHNGVPGKIYNYEHQVVMQTYIGSKYHLESTVLWTGLNVWKYGRSDYEWNLSNLIIDYGENDPSTRNLIQYIQNPYEPTFYSLMIATDAKTSNTNGVICEIARQ